MRIVTVLALFLFLSVVTSHAEEIISVTLKNGKILTWTNYQEQGNQYCTQKSAGVICLDKATIASIRKEDDNPAGARVVDPKKETSSGRSTEPSTPEEIRKEREKRAERAFNKKYEQLQYEWARQCDGVYTDECRALMKELHRKQQEAAEEYRREKYNRPY